MSFSQMLLDNPVLFLSKYGTLDGAPDDVVWAAFTMGAGNFAVLGPSGIEPDVAASLADDNTAGSVSNVEELMAGGVPMVRIALSSVLDISAQFIRVTPFT